MGTQEVPLVVCDSNILRPLRALAIGLGWWWDGVSVKNGVEQNFVEGTINIAELDFNYRLVPQGDKTVAFHILIAQANETGVIGSFGLAIDILNLQKVGRDIIPAELRGDVQILFTQTILLTNKVIEWFAYLKWGVKPWDDRWRRRPNTPEYEIPHWRMSFHRTDWVSCSTYSTRLVCPRRLPLAA